MPTGISEGVSVKLVECRVFLGLRGLGLAFAVLAFLLPTINASRAEDRTISMYNIHTKETINVTFKRNGKFDHKALQKLNHFMRDWRRNQQIRMDPDLIDLVWELHHELGARAPVHLISGYRSAATNNLLRRTSGGQARRSRHITGQAADIMIPGIPLKQLRYSALMHQRGGVGYYPRSGLPFVHVDTGNVRYWPRMRRMELAMLFPRGHSLYIPSDGRPLRRADYRVATARAEEKGLERPWALTRKRPETMLASLVPNESPFLQRTSLADPPPALTRPVPFKEAILAPQVKPDSKLLQLSAEALEALLAEEGEEQDDYITFEPLPATFLLAEKPLTYSDVPDGQTRTPVFPKIGLLMEPASVLASEEFDHRLQIEDLYEANRFRGRAIAFSQRLKVRMTAALQRKAKRASLR
jgi:uncharacterized protein YcbK (DUF882 family)